MATVRIPISRQVRATRTAISPRFAMRTLRMATLHSSREAGNLSRGGRRGQHSYTPLLLLPWRPAFAVRGKPMELDRQELSWKARHDRRAPGRGAGRLILALALLGPPLWPRRSNLRLRAVPV